VITKAIPPARPDGHGAVLARKKRLAMMRLRYGLTNFARRPRRPSLLASELKLGERSDIKFCPAAMCWGRRPDAVSRTALQIVASGDYKDTA